MIFMDVDSLAEDLPRDILYSQVYPNMPILACAHAPDIIRCPLRIFLMVCLLLSSLLPDGRFRLLMATQGSFRSVLLTRPSMGSLLDRLSLSVCLYVCTETSDPVTICLSVCLSVCIHVIFPLAQGFE